MIVYVESNFVLELAFLQEEQEACDRILQLAEADRLTVALPAFSVAEPYGVQRRNASRRSRLHDDLSYELRQLSRSRSYGEQVEGLVEVVGLLTRSAVEERQRLHRVMVRILEAAEVIPAGAEVLREAIVRERDGGLAPEDAIVYSSVLQHLRGREPQVEKRFLNRNAKDFLTPDIESDLRPFSCAVIPSFRDGLAWIEARLS